MIKKDRYPGIRAFEADDERLFYGRSTEVDDLFSLVIVKPLVVLFGKSGLGKSSLLKAGLGSVLLKNQYFPIMIRVQDTSISPVEMVLSELKPFLDEKKLVQFGTNSTNQIWETINACNFTDSNGNPATPVLIFDQFEELFNHDKSTQSEWAVQIADLIEGRRPKDVTEALHGIPRRERTPEQLAWFEPPEVKLLFAIRSDRMSALHQLRYQIPGILQHRYELKPLQSIQAREAIIKPAALTGAEFTTQAFNYAPETVQEIQNNLSNEVGEIESFQLQVVCQHIEEKVKAQQFQGMQDILATPDFLGGQGGIQNILKNYYDNHINNLGTEEDQLAARKLLEEGLIADGRRIGVADAVVKGTYGIDDDLLEKLLDSRLIRPENTRLGRTYEISHDTLVGPILAAYEKRRLEEERIAKQKELEERDQQLAIERNKRRRSNMITAGAVVLSLLAIGASIFAWVKWDQATEAKAFAFEKQLEAEESQDSTKIALDKADSLRIVAEGEKIKAEKQKRRADQEKAEAIIQKENAEKQKGRADSLRIVADEEKKVAENAQDTTKVALKRADSLRIVADKEKVRALIEKKNAEIQKEKADSSNALSQSIIDALYFYGDSLALASKSIYEDQSDTYGEYNIYYGFIGKDGDPKIDYEYDESTNFSSITGYATVKRGGEKFLLSPDKQEYRLATKTKDLSSVIEVLDLSDQGLKRVPSVIFKYPQLKILYLDFNKIKSLPKKIGQLDSLQHLSFDPGRFQYEGPFGNPRGLKSLPKEIGQLSKLQYLSLPGSRLTSLPKEIGQLSNLQTLDLRNCLYLRSLPKEIGQLSKLQYLNLEFIPYLTSLPKEIGQLSKLHTLRLGYTSLRKLPKEISELDSLVLLDLSGTMLDSLPKEIGQLSNLQTLYLSTIGMVHYNDKGSLLRSLPKEIGNLEKLQTLDLSWNSELAKLPPEIGNLKNLQTLNLWGTKISENEILKIRKLLPKCQIIF